MLISLQYHYKQAFTSSHIFTPKNGMIKYLLFGFLFINTLIIFSQPVLNLEVFASGFADPVDIANAGDARLFIVEREGVIKIIDSSGEVLETPFLNISEKIESGYNEQGLLGLVFHPDYSVNGYFYVNYINNDENTVIARYSVSEDNENIADEESEYIIYEAEQPYVNHNGGDLNFGPDGYFYFGLGDGGSAGDPGNRAQDPEEKLGKIHRIDVDGAEPFSIPADNPYYGSEDTLETIWDIGVRNPWRISFDRLTGDMWIGDVGQNLYEEIDFEPAGSGGGFNYGWRCYEADEEFNDSGCDDESSYTFPIYTYFHSFSLGGYAITGGYVYRGSEYPDLNGYYICADFVSGNWWTLKSDGSGGWLSQKIDDLEADISTFGEDMNGELYCADLYEGKIYRIQSLCTDFVLSSTKIDYECGLTDGSIDLNIEGGEDPYSISWSNGETTEDISGLSPGLYTATVTDNKGCVSTETIEIENIPVFVASITEDAGTLIASDGLTFQWFLNGEEIISAVSNSYVPTESGLYSVLITDANGCQDTSDVFDFIFEQINQFSFINNIEIFPVPADNYLTLAVFANTQFDATIQITDANGKLVKEIFQNMISGENTVQFDLTDFAAGIYTIQLKKGMMFWQNVFIKSAITN